MSLVYFLLNIFFLLLSVGLLALGGHFWATAQLGVAIGCFMLACVGIIGQKSAHALWWHARVQRTLSPVPDMSPIRLYLLLVVSFSLMFVGLVALGGHFWAATNKGAAIGCFLLAFASVIGQMGSLALFLRERMRRSARRLQSEKDAT